jgi:hypothetical protein
MQLWAYVRITTERKEQKMMTELDDGKERK